MLLKQGDLPEQVGNVDVGLKLHLIVGRFLVRTVESFRCAVVASGLVGAAFVPLEFLDHSLVGTDQFFQPVDLHLFLFQLVGVLLDQFVHSVVHAFFLFVFVD